jgi:hypothetical protein
MSGINISKFIPNSGFKIPTNIKTPVTSTFTRLNTNISHADTGFSIGRLLAYLFAIFVVIMVILLFVHYFIKPIFRLRPGDPGYITIPGFDDGVLFWNKGYSGIIQDKGLPIAKSYFNYSLTMDIFIENPLQFTQGPRVILRRGGSLKDSPTSDTLLGYYNSYNLIVALLPDTNDLLVSVLNSNNNMENVLISNVPVQEPFRVGVIVMERALEVYMNGRLVKTRTFDVPLLASYGDIFPPSGIATNIVKVRNLKLWNRILKTGEMREATPALSSTKDFSPSAMPSSSANSCSSRLEKLSANTLSDLSTDLTDIGNVISSDVSSTMNKITSAIKSI